MSVTPPELNWDIVEVNGLLDIVLKTAKDRLPSLPNIQEAAMIQLRQIDEDLWAQMHPEEAKARKEAEEARLKAEEEKKAEAKKRAEAEAKAKREKELEYERR